MGNLADCQESAQIRGVAQNTALQSTKNHDVTTPANPITINLIQPPVQTKDFWDAVKVWAPYLAALIALIGVFAGVFIAVYQLRMGARYTYASEILKFRLRQIQEFYAPALLLIEQSRIVYEKLLWSISKVKPEFPMDGFRLLDHIYSFKGDEALGPIIKEILDTGEKLTKLIIDKSGLIEGGLLPTFIEYQAHFAILNAANKQKMTETAVEGANEFGYYPRMLNREIREGFKVVLAHLENYTNAGDKIIYRLLEKKPSEIGKYRRQLLDNLTFYETHASAYASKFDNFDMSLFRQRFIDAIENTRSQRNVNFTENTISILDVGSGTGRDTYEFLKKGYVITAMEPSPALLRECRRKIRMAYKEPENDKMKHAAELSIKRCSEITFDEMRCRNEFDGVWASASLLHVPTEQMEDVLHKIILALKSNGVLFMSLKYGHGEHEYDQRFYTYFTRKDIRALLKSSDCTREIKVWLSDANGKDISAIKQLMAWWFEWVGYFDRRLWLNIIVKKLHT
jgi:SAM-dependent methyltransferase